MVQYGPRDLPRLREELLRFGATDIAAALRKLDAEEGRLRPGRAQATADWMAAATILPDATLYHISPEMCELIVAAARNLPDFALEVDDPPDRAGLLWFTSPITDVDQNGESFQVAAVTWQVRADCIRLSILAARDSVPGKIPEHRLVATGFPPVFPFGHWDSPLASEGLLPSTGWPGAAPIAAVKTAWLLLRQPLTEQEVLEPNRTQRRQAAREGREAPPVRVIRLRRPQGGKTDGPPGSVAWHHQWMVRGHWRMQAWGPGRQLRRPVWIAPFVKGPEGAPMLGGEKVYLFDRTTGEPLARPESPEAPPDSE